MPTIAELTCLLQATAHATPESDRFMSIGCGWRAIFANDAVEEAVDLAARDIQAERRKRVERAAVLIEERHALGMPRDFPERRARRFRHAVVEHRVDHEDLRRIVASLEANGVGRLE